MRVSVIIPAYEEEKRISVTLRHIADHAGDIGITEVIVVDDGSSDRTAEVSRSFANVLPMHVIVLPQNRGKGAAVREGMRHANGDACLLYDADAATPIGELPRLLQEMESASADIVIGSRVLGGRAIVSMQWHRRMVGMLFHMLCRPLLPGIADASCGFKLFRKPAADVIFAEQTVDRFAFDIEILRLAVTHGFSVKEVPVHWNAVEGSKVRLWKDGWEMLRTVLTLYVRACRR